MNCADPQCQHTSLNNIHSVSCITNKTGTPNLTFVNGVWVCEWCKGIVPETLLEHHRNQETQFRHAVITKNSDSSIKEMQGPKMKNEMAELKGLTSQMMATIETMAVEIAALREQLDKFQAPPQKVKKVPRPKSKSKPEPEAEVAAEQQTVNFCGMHSEFVFGRPGGMRCIRPMEPHHVIHWAPVGNGSQRFIIFRAAAQRQVTVLCGEPIEHYSDYGRYCVRVKGHGDGHVDFDPILGAPDSPYRIPKNVSPQALNVYLDSDISLGQMFLHDHNVATIMKGITGL